MYKIAKEKQECQFDALKLEENTMNSEDVLKDNAQIAHSHKWTSLFNQYGYCFAAFSSPEEAIICLTNLSNIFFDKFGSSLGATIISGETKNSKFELEVGFVVAEDNVSETRLVKIENFIEGYIAGFLKKKEEE